MLNIAVIYLAIAVGLIAVNQLVASLRTEELRQQISEMPESVRNL